MDTGSFPQQQQSAYASRCKSDWTSHCHIVVVAVVVLSLLLDPALRHSCFMMAVVSFCPLLLVVVVVVAPPTLTRNKRGSLTTFFHTEDIHHDNTLNTSKCPRFPENTFGVSKFAAPRHNNKKSQEQLLTMKVFGIQITIVIGLINMIIFRNFRDSPKL